MHAAIFLCGAMRLCYHVIFMNLTETSTTTTLYLERPILSSFMLIIYQSRRHTCLVLPSEQRNPAGSRSGIG